MPEAIEKLGLQNAFENVIVDKKSAGAI